MASSKCGAAASAPRVSASPPSPRAPCKMVFTKVNIGRRAAQGTRQPPAGLPNPGPHPDRPGLVLAVAKAPGHEEMPVGQTRRASPKVAQGPESLAAPAMEERVGSLA